MQAVDTDVFHLSVLVTSASLGKLAKVIKMLFLMQASVCV